MRSFLRALVALTLLASAPCFAGPSQTLLVAFPARAPVSTPAQIFGTSLHGWWQTYAANNVTSGGAFTQLTDQSALGVRLNGANSPAVVTLGINGRVSANLTSATLSFFQSNVSLALSQPMLIGYIFKPAAVAVTGNARVWVAQDGGGAATATYQDDSTPTVNANATGGSSILASALADGNVMTVVVYFNGASSYVMINHGAKVGVGTSIGTAGLGVMNFGLHPGANPDFSANGLVSEILCVAGSVTDAQATSLQNYLNAQAGI